MNQQPKRYKLLLSAPDADAGTILTFDGKNNYDYVSKTGCLHSWYMKEIVENNPNWFQEIKEEKYTLSEMYNESMDAAYNLAIGHAIKIVETYFHETLHRIHPYMATALIQKLNNLKKP